MIRCSACSGALGGHQEAVWFLTTPFFCLPWSSGSGAEFFAGEESSSPSTNLVVRLPGMLTHRSFCWRQRLLWRSTMPKQWYLASAGEARESVHIHQPQPSEGKYMRLLIDISLNKCCFFVYLQFKILGKTTAQGRQDIFMIAFSNNILIINNTEFFL